jgi:hypothetical protein
MQNTTQAKNKRRIKRIARFIVLLICVIAVSSLPASAIAYRTYIFSFDNNSVESPHAYVPEKVVDSVYINDKSREVHNIDWNFLETPLDGPQDLFVAPDGTIYIADQRNSRIIALNPDYSGKFILSSFLNMWGVPDSFNQPRGVFATDREIFVADTEKNRIVVFDKQGRHLRIINEPVDDVFPEGHVYKPVSLVVDRAGRIYVVSSTTNQGIIAMSPDGEFLGFLGAIKSVVNPFMIFWRNFQTREQRQQMLRNVPTEYNNIAIDEDGFLWVTTSSIDPTAQQTATMDNESDYAPVKRLNPQGADVLRRSGFTGPGGEVGHPFGLQMRGPGISKIIDVALGPEGTWTIIDELRQRAYTYDEDGRLLFVFGDDGPYFGNIQSIQAVAYQGTKMLLLDKAADSFTVYKRTQYGDIMIQALHNQRNRQFDRAVEDWREILKRNNNSDLAYIGIGKSFHRDGEYQLAMEQFRFALDIESYSDSFQAYRKLWIENNVIVVPLVVIAIIAAVILFFNYAGKVNKRDQIRDGRKLKLSSHLLYGFHIIFRPFDGFWDMKHEKRGSMLAATIYLFLACAMFIFKGVGEAFIVNPRGIYNNFIVEALGIIVPISLWVISNWCLTTLFDGEGSMKDVYMASCYALVPIIPIVFGSTLATHFITLGEVDILNMIGTVMFVWVGFLLFVGVMVIHDYSLGKNVVTVLGSIGGATFIMFVAVLFSGLLLRMVQFVQSIWTEVSYRL